MFEGENQKVVVRRSGTEGFGLFAQSKIAVGERVRKRNVVRKVDDHRPLTSSESADHVCTINGEFWLVGPPDCYINHSCDPTSYLVFEPRGIWLIARRDCEPSQEITLDYLINNSGGNSWPCNCGAVRCRRQTGTSYFELPKSFQLEYLPLLADWFIDSHRAQIDSLKAAFGD
jgi:SET domain-containing protein